MNEPSNEEAWLRLSDAIARLCAAGVGEADAVKVIADAGLRGLISATGLQSVSLNHNYSALPDPIRVHRRMWRILCHPEAKAKGYECFTVDESLVWTRGGSDDFMQEKFDVVLFHRPSFELWLRDVVDTYRPCELSQEEIEEWIRDYPGSNYKTAWADFQRHFGARPFKRDERFMPAWRKVRGNPQRGQPKKSNKSIAPA